VVQPALAILQTLALQGFTANPFSGQAIAPTASATNLRVGYKFGIEGNPHIRAEDIYMGTYAPIDAEGKSLAKIYHLFVAPQLQGTRTFNETSKHLGALSDGFKVTNPVYYHKDLTKALAGGGDDIEGKLFIPSLNILNGGDPNKLNGEKVRPVNNMFALRETGDFKGSYTLSGSYNAICMLSSSPRPDVPYGVRIAVFSDGHDDWYNRVNVRFSGRPCRVVGVSHLTL
jgi:hypothetical protein